MNINGYHADSFLDAAQIIRLAGKPQVRDGKDEANCQHDERHCRAIPQLEADKSVAIHVGSHNFTGVDRPTPGHDPDQVELSQRTQNGKQDGRYGWCCQARG